MAHGHVSRLLKGLDTVITVLGVGNSLGMVSGVGNSLGMARSKGTLADRLEAMLPCK